MMANLLLLLLLLLWDRAQAHNYLSDKVRKSLPVRTVTTYFTNCEGSCQQDEDLLLHARSDDQLRELPGVRGTLHWLLWLGEDQQAVQRPERHHHRQDRVRQVQLQT